MVAKSRKKKAKKKTAKKAKTEEVKEVKKDKIERDRFGSVKGSRNAKINAVLSKKPKKMSQLVKEAKVPGTYYDHCNELVKSGLVVKTEEGFALA